MKTSIIIGLVLTLTVFRSSSQCLTSKYINIANKVFEGKLTAKDFEGKLFLTIDTVNAESLNVPSLYYEFIESSELIELFNQAMVSINIKGSFFNYYESFNNSLYNSPLHQSFLVNSSKYTYLIHIWNNPKNITKIEGLTISKLNEQQERTNY
jgi:hypothetical protein